MDAIRISATTGAKQSQRGLRSAIEWAGEGGVGVIVCEAAAQEGPQFGSLAGKVIMLIELTRCWQGNAAERAVP